MLSRLPLVLVQVTCLLASILQPASAVPTSDGHTSTALVARQNPQSCPGYRAQNVRKSSTGLTADLTLAGQPCNIFGKDVQRLKLEVEVQSGKRLHVKISNGVFDAYEVPPSVLPRPKADGTNFGAAELQFDYVASPFSFSVTRKGSSEVLFDTKGSPLVFEPQYLRLRTSLPNNPNLYGLGEHADDFRLKTVNYKRTLWNVDAARLPSNSNLYGSHPIYFDHRGNAGTHGVFLLNSDGMDVKIDDMGGQHLEYNVIGGVLDFYFVAGPTPAEVSQQYAEIVGLPAMTPYWGFGFHQCKYGYQDVYELADVVSKYEQSGIPLEVMWTDIDYMKQRADFTLDTQRFKPKLMRQLVDHLHRNDQKYIVITDPAQPSQLQGYQPFARGKAANVFLKNRDGSLYEGVTWPGPSVFPDWFAPNTQSWWNGEFARFYSPRTGLDIDGAWLDLNEAANFCSGSECRDAAGFASSHHIPPNPPQSRPNAGHRIPGFPADFQPNRRRSNLISARAGGRNPLTNPAYKIGNFKGEITTNVIATNVRHSNKLKEYDAHNLFGKMSGTATRNALLARRPGKRPFTIVRSTFPGSGRDVGAWTGDILSTWAQYRLAIHMQLQFTAIYQIPMIGSDVGGFSGDTTENLLARWATMGALQPFYRNHKGKAYKNQEFYLYPKSTAAAKFAISLRYQLLDYMYTALYGQTSAGTPHVSPLFFMYPNDPATFPIQYQYFLGDSLLVSPVTDDDATSVTAYLPDDLFYDFFTHLPVQGRGGPVTLSDVPFDRIPLHIRGGSIIPLRDAGAKTTTAARNKNFSLTIAPDANGRAKGTLYLDDGESINQTATSSITFSYANGKLTSTGNFGYDAGRVKIATVVLLGVKNGGDGGQARFDAKSQSLTYKMSLPLTRAFSANIG